MLALFFLSHPIETNAVLVHDAIKDRAQDQLCQGGQGNGAVAKPQQHSQLVDLPSNMKGGREKERKRKEGKRSIEEKL